MVAVVQNSEIPRGSPNVKFLLRPSVSRGARYGASLLALGRLDGDKYEDFAVGAPYENIEGSLGTGAVYIYRGSKDFWTEDGANGKYTNAIS